MMTITGEQFIGGRSVSGAGKEFHGIEAATGKAIEPAFYGGTRDDVGKAASFAWEAFPVYRETTLEKRAEFLETIADQIIAIGDELIDRATRETGLSAGHLERERTRTVGQLRLFANEVRKGDFQELRFDPSDPSRRPVPKPDLRLRNVALGPVAVFGASNFPLAFSVAGGDTVSALAAGCPVIVKAHPAHPGTSELVGRAVQKAVELAGFPAGQDSGFEVGQALVADPRIRAVGFTGSQRGGLALMKIASERKQPIPVYAEMSSINPVILFPNALRNRAEEIGRAFVSSLLLGAGQFCTNPGLILAIDDTNLDRFIASATTALSAAAAQTMLTGGICEAYKKGVAKLRGHADVTTIVHATAEGSHQIRAALSETTGAAFLSDRALYEEVFGASSLIVRCRDGDELRKVLEALEGQLTVSLHVDDGDLDTARVLVPNLELLAGRILVNGFGTGVEVSPAMVHGGPYPATSDGRSTSVGTLAIYRFLRPVSYQDFPSDLLPPALRDCSQV
jgi:NADP-dependent aldehyde dehydrogenase